MCQRRTFAIPWMDLCMVHRNTWDQSFHEVLVWASEHRQEKRGVPMHGNMPANYVPPLEDQHPAPVMAGGQRQAKRRRIKGNDDNHDR